MANKKMTKRDYFAILRESYPATADNYDEVVAFIDHEVELLTRKNSSEKKPTPMQIAVVDIKMDILDGMEINHLYTVSELIKVIPTCAELTIQRVSALLRQMVNDGAVTRTEDKRKAYFSKVC